MALASEFLTRTSSTNKVVVCDPTALFPNKKGPHGEDVGIR